MDFDDCFHEICHLWVMVNYLGFDSGKACVAYDNGGEGMLTIEGYTTSYNGYDDLVDNLSFIIAGVAGDKINDQFSDEDDIYDIFCSDDFYSQDNKWLKKLYKTAVHYHDLKVSEKDWFNDKLSEIEEYLSSENLEEIKAAAEELLENSEYVLSQEA